MKIASVETFVGGQVGLTRVRTDAGDEGWGQVSTFNPDISAEVLHRQVARHAIGAEVAGAEDIGTLVESVVEREYKFFGTYLCRALTGLDTALWDLVGKAEGKSVAELAGGSPRPIAAYGSSMRRDIAPGDEAERMRRLAGERGYRAFKVRIGSVMGHDRDQRPGRTEELVPAVRRAVGRDVTILADGNGCYSSARAIEVGRLLESEGYGHFEEPCPYWELEETARVADALDIDVAGGEQDYSMPQWRRIIAMRAVDVVQPDVCYVGGFARALEVARTARDAGLACTPQSANLSLVTVFTMHLLAAAPNAGPFMEFSIEPTRWAEGIYTPALVVKDGEVPFPEGPGWGVTVNDDWLARAERRASEG
ncbi:MAG: mandelate racemase/muconate lactonizing enzyme family protein [Planctomycetota bacterium]|jgi:L-alanine-DL-glutamate epimerase-like enolase superfamily enzyme